ncbi:cytochrome c [Sphingobacterium spiritivorum]|uniref:monooxygenase n=1 Tax=Sphingobacterium spiritivorum TaxID=258 RepID=UPI003DA2767F
MKNTIFKLILSIIILSTFEKIEAQTYYKDIQPIISKNCSSCHKPGESAPFSLLTYNDVSKRSSFIKKVVQDRYMPPWIADNSYVHFANDRSLTQNEIETIVKWVDNGAKEGKKTNQKKVETIIETSNNRNPDLKIVMVDSFLLKGDNKERFVEYKIPFEISQEENIEAVEFFSNNKRIIHHANYAVQIVEDNNIDLHSAPSFVNFTDGKRYQSDPYVLFKKKLAYYGGWIPGAGYERYPESIGWKIPKRGVVLLTVHYAPSATDEKSICGINLFYSKKAVERKVTVVSFGSGGLGERDIRPTFFMIPANQESTYSLKFTNPAEDLSLLYIWPHMHFIGKKFKAYLTNENQDTIPLVNIPKWDYRWQEMYRFKNFIRIPRGSVVHMECTYDNTAQNPNNPFSPPQTIFSYGDMRSTQEMMTMLLIYIPYKEGDEYRSTEIKDDLKK